MTTTNGPVAHHTPLAALTSRPPSTCPPPLLPPAHRQPLNCGSWSTYRFLYYLNVMICFNVMTYNIYIIVYLWYMTGCTSVHPGSNLGCRFRKGLNLHLIRGSCSAFQLHRTPNPGLGAGSVRVREVWEPDRDQSSRYLFHLNLSVFHCLMYEVILQVDMLCSCMEFVVLG